jgi:hypothetical protein
MSGRKRARPAYTPSPPSCKRRPRFAALAGRAGLAAHRAPRPPPPPRFGHNGVAARLQKACNVSASSAKLQAAGWLGALLNAARGGHERVARLLMADGDAPAMLAKIYEGRKPSKDGPLKPPNPEKDPLAVAAARGHAAIVELLSPQRALCAPCAAVAAAKAGHGDVFAHLALGPAKSLLEVRARPAGASGGSGRERRLRVAPGMPSRHQQRQSHTYTRARARARTHTHTHTRT